MSTQREECERRARDVLTQHFNTRGFTLDWSRELSAITDALLAWGEECRSRALEDACTDE